MAQDVTLLTAESSLRKGGWMVGRGLKVLSIMVGRAWERVLGAAAHVASAVRKQREDKK